MTSYKKVAEETQSKLDTALARIQELENMPADVVSDEDGKEVLRRFADRCENREEALLLIRVLSKLKE